MPNAPPDAEVARFRNDLERLTADRADLRLLVAVSGGADSLALLLLAHAALGDHCIAMTVDHRVRPESSDEAHYVAAVCRDLGVEHELRALELTPDEKPRGNLSGRLRDHRYRLLFDHARHRNALVTTAHHADDQLETMLMRLNRGSGVAGLAGIRGSRTDLVRPLLHWRKAELEAVVAQCGLVPVDDPTNRDARFDRARIRARLIDADWLDPLAFARSASALADAEDALEWAADREFHSRFVQRSEGGAVLDIEDWRDTLPRELRRRLLVKLVRKVDPDCDIREATLERLMAAIDAGKTITVGRALLRVIGGHCVVEHAPPRSDAAIPPAAA